MASPAGTAGSGTWNPLNQFAKLMNISLNRRGGFTLIEIMIVVGIIAMLVAMAAPNFTRQMGASKVTVIKNNLRLIDTAKLNWAIEYKKNEGDVPAEEDIAQYLKGSKMPTPAAGETYHIQPIGEPPYAICDKPIGDIKPNTKIFEDM
jgi:prepilin-type N-terminal cleavage/methylation domain-containing protein